MSMPHNEELFLAIGRLEGKIDSILAQQTRQNDELKSHDERIRSLEQSKSHILGYSAAAGGILGLVANYVIRAFA